MPKNSRFTCKLARDEQGECTEIARVTVVDSTGERTRGCARHAVQALDGIANGQVDWDDSKSLNEFEVKALEISEKRSQVYRYGAP